MPLFKWAAQSVNTREPVRVAAVIVALAESIVLNASAWPSVIRRAALGSSTHARAAVPVGTTSGGTVT